MSKNYEELTLRDHFMFGKICLKPENSQLILSALLNDDITVVTTDVEKVLIDHKDNKYVRLDILAKDEFDRVYDAELQHESTNINRQKELPKRARYNQSMIDSALLEAGKEYLELPDVYIIFICTFDPFGKGLPRYTFRTRFVDDDISYNDGVQKIFFNTTADLSVLPESAKNMLEYINTGTISDGTTEKIDSAVKEARLKEGWRLEYMLAALHDEDVFSEGYGDGFNKGYDSGSKEKLQQIISNMLKKKTPDADIIELTQCTRNDLDAAKRNAD